MCRPTFNQQSTHISLSLKVQIDDEVKEEGLLDYFLKQLYFR